jgi:hypothetical protein
MAVRPDPSGPIPEAPVRGAPAARPTGSRFLQMRDARGEHAELLPTVSLNPLNPLNSLNSSIASTCWLGSSGVPVAGGEHPLSSPDGRETKSGGGVRDRGRSARSRRIDVRMRRAMSAQEEIHALRGDDPYIGSKMRKR